MPNHISFLLQVFFAKATLQQFAECRLGFFVNNPG